MAKEMKTFEVARKLVSEFRKTGNLVELVEEACAWGWWFGRYGRYNRLLFQQFMVDELKGVRL